MTTPFQPSTIEGSIFKLVELGTGLDNWRIYYAKQNAPKLLERDGQYAILDVGGHSGDGTTSLIVLDEPFQGKFKQVVKSCRVGLFELQIFGGVHREAMEQFILSLRDQAFDVLARELGLTVEEPPGTTVEDTEDLDTIWDNRTIREFRYRFTITRESPADVIETLIQTQQLTT